MSSPQVVLETPPVSPSVPESQQSVHFSPHKPSPFPLQRPISQKRRLYDSLMADDRTQVSYQDTPLQKLSEFRKKTDLDRGPGRSQSQSEENLITHDAEDFGGDSNRTSEEIEQDAQPRSPLPGSCASRPIILVEEGLESSYNSWVTRDGDDGAVEVSQQPGKSRRDNGLPQQIDRSKRKTVASTCLDSGARVSKRSRQGPGRSSAKKYVDRAIQCLESAPNAPLHPGDAPAPNEGGHPHARFNACTTLKIKDLKYKWIPPNGPWRRYARLENVEIDDYQLEYS